MNKHKMTRKHQRWIGYGVFVVVLLIMIIVRMVCGTVVIISGTSMVPTFNDWDCVLGSVVHDNTELEFGDIVMFEQDGKLLVKRIYGTPGVTICPSYIKNIPPVKLGESEYYMLGDNWKGSRDSRDFGPVNRDAIKFKYTGIRWNGWSGFIGVLIPIILLSLQMAIVLLPPDIPVQEKATSGGKPKNGAATGDDEKGSAEANPVETCELPAPPKNEEEQNDEHSES